MQPAPKDTVDPHGPKGFAASVGNRTARKTSMTISQLLTLSSLILLLLKRSSRLDHVIYARGSIQGNNYFLI